jgi:hydroxymethylpyrimidine/phosphomethylpyrimidine kinase
MKTALTIAGFDPSGGAGLQADLKVFQSFGVYGLSVVSAVTAQNSKGVKAVMPVSAASVKKQLSVLLTDIRPDALKTGMLYSRENIGVLVGIIKKYRLKNIVIDPVLISSTGKILAEKGMQTALKKQLLPLCTVITPNIHEAAVLSGISVKTARDMEKAAVILHDMGAEYVIITGGHLEKTAVDIVYDGSFHLLKGRKLQGEYHGTGCRFSAAVTALLGQGVEVVEAAKRAKAFMRSSFRKTFSTGSGMRLFKL